MSNPNPPIDNLRPFKSKGDETLGKVIGTRYRLAIEAQLEQMEDKHDFIRSAVEAKMRAEGLIE
jgi:hypothetical protein